MPDGVKTPASEGSDGAGTATALVGVVLIGHGSSASALLDAARNISPSADLRGIEALDAGVGRNESLDAAACDAVDRVDAGKGVLILVDLFGSSPCACGLAQGGTREVVVIAGLNLAMVMKLVGVDRGAVDAVALAQACADSARRSIVVKQRERSEPAREQEPQ